MLDDYAGRHDLLFICCLDLVSKTAKRLSRLMQCCVYQAKLRKRIQTEQLLYNLILPFEGGKNIGLYEDLHKDFFFWSSLQPMLCLPGKVVLTNRQCSCDWIDGNSLERCESCLLAEVLASEGFTRMRLLVYSS